MALINSTDAKRLNIPHEPGQWVEVRPLMAGDLESLTAEGSQVKVSMEALASIISAWSYDDPPTLENVRRLDIETFTWLGTASLQVSGIRDDEEKKDSDSPSSLTSQDEIDPSLGNSPT